MGRLSHDRGQQRKSLGLERGAGPLAIEELAGTGRHQQRSYQPYRSSEYEISTAARKSVAVGKVVSEVRSEAIEDGDVVRVTYSGTAEPADRW